MSITVKAHALNKAISNTKFFIFTVREDEVI